MWYRPVMLVLVGALAFGLTTATSGQAASLDQIGPSAANSEYCVGFYVDAHGDHTVVAERCRADPDACLYSDGLTVYEDPAGVSYGVILDPGCDLIP